MKSTIEVKNNTYSIWSYLATISVPLPLYVKLKLSICTCYYQSQLQSLVSGQFTFKLQILQYVSRLTRTFCKSVAVFANITVLPAYIRANNFNSARRGPY